MVRTRTRLSQIPVTRETAVVGTVSRSDTWETQGIVRNERWVKDGCQCRHVLESLCKVLSAVAPHTPQKAMPCRSHGSFLDHAPPSTNRFTCCSLGLSISIGWSQFGSCATSTSSIAPPWPNGSSSSLSTAPRWPKGSSSVLLLPSAAFLGACCLTSSFYLSSCRANMVEQSLAQHCQMRRLLTPPQIVPR